MADKKRVDREPKVFPSKDKEFPEGTENETTDYATAVLLQKTREDGIQTMWDRAKVMKPCPIGGQGACCNTCSLGPCRIIEDKPEKSRGICGASAATIAARNFGRYVAIGTAAHSDHGRHVASTFLAAAKGELPDYSIRDTVKLRALADEWGLDGTAGSEKDLAIKVGEIAQAQFSQQDGEAVFMKRVPPKRLALWRKMGVVPRGGDREVVELLHRTDMGMDQDHRTLMRQVSRTALADGFIGCMISTELQDILFGTPKPLVSQANLGALESDYVNIAVHGHEPLLTDPMVRFASSPEAKAMAEKIGAKGVNVVGVCCTANEMLMRHGVPVAGNYSQQELIMSTGAVDAMVVDYQCVVEGISDVASNYHTKLIATSPKCNLPGSVPIHFNEERVDETAKRIVKEAVDNYKNRGSTLIPNLSSPLVAGFTVETIKYMLGGSFRPSFRPLNDAIIDGRIRGIAGVVGCDSPQRDGDIAGSAHENLVKELIANDVLVVQTGCSAIACGRAGLMTPEAMAYAGDGLRSICEAVGIPPVLHAGACVDNSRALVALAEIVREGGLGEDISDLPVAGAAPEYIDPKAIAIGQYFVDYGLLVAFRPQLPVAGSKEFSRFIFEEYEELTGGKWAHAKTTEEVGAIMMDHINKKRLALGIHEKQERVLFDMAMRREIERTCPGPAA